MCQRISVSWGVCDGDGNADLEVNPRQNDAEPLGLGGGRPSTVSDIDAADLVAIVKTLPLS